MSSRSENSDDAAQRMLGAVSGAPALGRGPVSNGGFSRHDYHHPAAGWGAARSVARVIEKAGDPIEGFRALFVMNHQNGGFDCPGCAWPDDPNGLRLDICENGVKHVTWELTRKQVDREFFAAHTVPQPPVLPRRPREASASFPRLTPPRSNSGIAVAFEARFGRPPYNALVLARHCQVSIRRLPGLLRFGNRRQRLIVCPLLEAALDLFRRRRSCAVGDRAVVCLVHTSVGASRTPSVTDTGAGACPAETPAAWS